MVRSMPVLQAPLLLAFLAALCRAQDQLPGTARTTLLGYTFSTNVSEHAKLDRDQKKMEELTDDFKWSDATAIYSSGENSKKTDGKTRTLQKFSTEAGTKLNNEGFYRLFRAFWNGDAAYADSFVKSGLEDVGEVRGRESIFRAETANKGSQYQNVWMYVIHELEDAIDDCSVGKPTNNDDASVKAWDEAWAFYTGSLAAEGNHGANGFMPFTLAEKRCENFGTCNTAATSEVGRAAVNTKLLALFKRGRGLLDDLKCKEMIAVKNDIVKQMTVPLMQGLIRYVYQTKKAKGSDTPDGKKNLEKTQAEGWAFAAAVLPLVHNCDAGVARMIVDNFRPSNRDPMKESEKKFVDKLTTVYRCLGFTCADVGKSTETNEYPECSESGPEYKTVVGTDRIAFSTTRTHAYEVQIW